MCGVKCCSFYFDLSSSKFKEQRGKEFAWKADGGSSPGSADWCSRQITQSLGVLICELMGHFRHYFQSQVVLGRLWVYKNDIVSKTSSNVSLYLTQSTPVKSSQPQHKTYISQVFSCSTATLGAAWDSKEPALEGATRSKGAMKIQWHKKHIYL